MAVQITHNQATKAKTPERIYDTTRGLHLWVKSPTCKYWIFRLSANGRRTDLSLGSFPRVGVAEARKQAAELAQKAVQGEPLTRGNKGREEAPAAPVIRFKELAEQIVLSKSPEWRSEKHAQQWTSSLERYCYPVIGEMALDEITTDHVLEILNPIWLAKTETATRVRSRLERVLAAATIKGLRSGVNPAMWRGHLECLLAQPKKFQKVEHHPALAYAALPAFIVDLQGRTGVAALALEFLILTAARTSEVLQAKRCEFAGDVWTVPAERMKACKEHRVPLPPRAKLLIERAMAMDPQSEFVFSRNGAALSSMALLVLLRRMGKGHITSHGFRSTFRDWCSEETDHSSEVAEMCLAHVVANKVEAAYRRGDLLAKRKKLLEDWANFCLATPKVDAGSSTQSLNAGDSHDEEKG